ncbi:hypothetical protein ALT1644_410034 [Alteromonas macleodii]
MLVGFLLRYLICDFISIIYAANDYKCFKLIAYLDALLKLEVFDYLMFKLITAITIHSYLRLFYKPAFSMQHVYP